VANTAVVYGREYDGYVLSFEVSGALKEGSLVMRDRETDSWWSIGTGDAIGGKFEGTRLEELPVGEKVRWGDWRRRHPDAQVLSLDSMEHWPRNAYGDYLKGDRTFASIAAKDERLPAKQPVYCFRMEGRPYAVVHGEAEGGAVFEVPGGEVFLSRPPGSDPYESTRAYFLADHPDAPDGRMTRGTARWVDRITGLAFDESAGFLEPEEGTGDAPRRLTGFDTFWYIWSNINEDTVILEQS